jgi:hypothetical protein
MAKTDWDKIADKQFKALDKAWQEDWGSLRKRVNHNH